MGRFILVNVGKKPHTLVLGHERRGTGVQTGFTKALKPSQQSVLILFLDFRGEIPYRGTLPADRSKPAHEGDLQNLLRARCPAQRWRDAQRGCHAGGESPTATCVPVSIVLVAPDATVLSVNASRCT